MAPRPMPPKGHKAMPPKQHMTPAQMEAAMAAAKKKK